MQLIKCFPTYGASVETVQLGGVSFRLTSRWCDRLAAWYVDLTLLDGTPVIEGVRLEPGCDVLRFADPALFAPYLGNGDPSPMLLCVDAGGSGQAATRSMVGLRFSGAGAGPILAGTVLTDTLGQTWRTVATVAKAANATVTLIAQATVPGAVEAEPFTVTTITAPTYAGVTVTNPGRAEVGLDFSAMAQFDLGSRTILVFVPSDEIPATTASATAPIVSTT